MKKENGFIATSLLYSFFLAFVTIFIAMVTIYLQNRVYLNKLEDSSKNSIYIREMKETGSVNITRNGTDINSCTNSSENIFTCGGNTYNFAKCETIYYNDSRYILEGCE